jgi:hypothetical protein
MSEIYYNLDTDDLLEYIDFQSISEDYDLKRGDISPHQVQQLRIILAEFIKQNWK